MTDERENAGPIRSRRVVVATLATAQTLAWGSSYYLPAILADPIAKSVGVPSSWVFGAFSAALLIAAFAGPAVGRIIDRHGGRGVLMLSNVVLAAGLVALAAATGVMMLFAAWVVLGFGMALGLDDAGFAALTALYGHNARADYRNHALCGLCLDAELATIDCPERRAWLAREASGLGGVQYGHRLAAELAVAGAGTSSCTRAYCRTCDRPETL